MAIRSEGEAGDWLVAYNGFPVNTGAMGVGVHFRVNEDLEAIGGVIALVRYGTGGPTAHQIRVDADLGLMAGFNYDDSTTSVLGTLVPGTGYTAFLNSGSSNTVTLSMLVDGSSTITSASGTQTAFVPDRMYVFETNGGEPTAITVDWIRIANEPFSAGEMQAEHASATAVKAGLVTARPFTGGDLESALQAGSGAVFTAVGDGISYEEWAPAVETITCTVSADVDLQNPDDGVTEIAPTILTTTLGNYAVGEQVSIQLNANGTGPITWSGTALPDGWTVSASGLITGAAGAPGGYSPEVTATNSAGSDTKAFAVTIAATGVATVQVSVPDTSLAIGQEALVVVTALDAGGDGVSGKTIGSIAITSQSNAFAVSSGAGATDSNGRTTFQIIGAEAGTGTMIVTIDGVDSDAILITVGPTSDSGLQVRPGQRTWRTVVF